MAKEHVISFRISDDQFKALQKRLETDQPTGMGDAKTPNRMGRKIVLDALNGRTTYKDENDRYVDWDAVGTSKPPVAATRSRKK